MKGENESKAEIAEYQATLARAPAPKRSDAATIALANANRDVLRRREGSRKLARLEKTQIALQLVERKKVEINAEAEAERLRRIAKGEADAHAREVSRGGRRNPESFSKQRPQGYENV